MILYIHDILAGNIDGLASKMLVNVLLWVIVLVSIIADLFAGVHKAKQNGEFIMSDGFKRTVSKFVLYFSALMITLGIDFMTSFVINSFGAPIPAIPYATIIASSYITLFIEGRSILEKAGQKRKRQINKDLSKLLDVIDAADEPDKIAKIKTILTCDNEDDNT